MKLLFRIWESLLIWKIIIKETFPKILRKKIVVSKTMFCYFKCKKHQSCHLHFSGFLHFYYFHFLALFTKIDPQTWISRPNSKIRSLTFSDLLTSADLYLPDTWSLKDLEDYLGVSLLDPCRVIAFVSI